MFKILLLGLAPVAIQIVVNQNKILKRYLQNALELTKLLEKEEDKPDEEDEILLDSDNKSEALKLNLKNLVLVKSANNYIEVYWMDDEVSKKQLIRNTLTRIEQQLSRHKNFIRCHRTAVINRDYIDEKHRDAHGNQIKLKGIEEPVPVSRQYKLKLKESLAL
jgi:DNA-binding LytR/AlgR family response regulator